MLATFAAVGEPVLLGDMLPSCTFGSGTGFKNPTFLRGEGGMENLNCLFQSLSVFSSEKITSLPCSNVFHSLIFTP